MDILEIKREFSDMKEKTDGIRRSLWLRKEKINYKRTWKIEDGFWSDKRKSSEIIKNMNFE